MSMLFRIAIMAALLSSCATSATQKSVPASQQQTKTKKRISPDSFTAGSDDSPIDITVDWKGPNDADREPSSEEK